ncbi:hypothetical protein [uncultured Parabacteroides sp.]|uniref:putative polyvalent protein kinase domain-containing protein n=1 Tax=uncultured Parabacteroides sp. TaxID=512312 RepID=UPI0025F866B4|nr:hypothetical protein [uncultured Parabacteroides sp.]
MDGTQQRFYQLLEDASGVVGRCKEATGNAEPAEGYKRRQISELIEFAFKYNLWISLDDSSVIFLDKGGENEVFYDGASSVIKLNNFDYAGDDLENFFTRIFAHNHFFSNVCYQLIGFSYNSKKEFCAVLLQPYVRAEREATESEIISYMKALSFVMDYPDEFHNDKYEIFDAVPNNVLHGIDGDLYFIDTQIRFK